MNPHISILLATYQGERFLQSQLDSIVVQTHQNWSLHVSDDGSTDRTLDILLNFKRSSERELEVLQGPRQGFLRNFMHLLASVPDSSEYFAFCDQDDRWVRDKLERAVRWLESRSGDKPLLYCSRTQSIDEEDQQLGLSPLFMHPPAFSNAMVQSIAGGNTMVFNRKVLELVRKCGTTCVLPSHDWWLYIVTTGAGGEVRYDPIPSVEYRQHDHNQVGANSTFGARFRRLKMLGSGRFRQWNDQHIAALDGCDHILTPQNQVILEHFKAMRNKKFPKNICHLLKGRFHRQTLAGNLGLLVGVILRKV